LLAAALPELAANVSLRAASLRILPRLNTPTNVSIHFLHAHLACEYRNVQFAIS